MEPDKKDYLGQAINSMVVADRGNKLDYESIDKLKKMMGTVAAPSAPLTKTLEYKDDVSWTDDNVYNAAGVSIPIGSAVTEPCKYQKTEFIKLILSIREKLSAFLDGSNILLSILDPQSIRETIKELRWDIREIKKNTDILEIDIVEYQEKMYDSKRKKYEEENDVPF